MTASFDPALWDDLRGQVRGELRTDPLARAMYSHDASILAVQPAAVFAPVHEADVQVAARFAAEHQLPLHARGAGTGLAGESLGPGLVLDFSRHFQEILEVAADQVRVQPGVVLDQLNARLKPLGRRFAPDPASSATCTLGGMIATNASGARALRAGTTRDHVRKLQVVLADGEAATVAAGPWASLAAADGGLAARVGPLVELLRDHAELIQACQPKARFDRLGYGLAGLLEGDHLHLPRLFCGSEGTLGLVTEATLATVPLPADRGVALFAFASLEQAARAAPLVLPAEPSASELLDRRGLTLACEADPTFADLVTPGVQAVLLVELEAAEAGAARRAAADLLRRMLPLRQHGLIHLRVAADETEANHLWRLRDLAASQLHSIRGPAQPVPFLEDVAVPPEALAEFLHKVQQILRQQQVTASFLIHAGAGQVHTRPFLDLAQREEVDRLRKVADATHRLVLDLGGSVSSQHGTGLARTAWVEPQYGRLAPLFRRVKELFDPAGLLNPGKIVTAGLADPLELLRPVARPRPEPIPLRLVWPEGGFDASVNRCNSCGTCRTQALELRMCPTFRAAPTEAASPRAKANLLREILGGRLDPAELASDELRAVADLCVNCKMCGQECPSRVPIPKLMLEAKAQHLAEEGWRWDDWVLARTESFAALGSTFAWLTNRLLASRSLRWLMAKFLGISRQRQLPRFASVSFMRLARRRGWTRLPRRSGGPKVAYFVDVYANYNDPRIAEATVAVLHHHGVEVYVPPGQTGCGMAPLAYGDVDTARRMARRNLNHLADLARAGYTVVCSEPTAALMLRQDYLDLLDENDSRMVAERTTELTAFLAGLHAEGKLRTDLLPLPLQVAHHVPCHLKALQLGLHGPGLLRLIPELRVEVLDVSCSGMAGTFGFKESGFAASLAAGQPMLQRFQSEALHAGSTECSACRLQMEHAGRKTTLHPVQYLALAYGLMPELADRLAARGKP